MRIDNHSLRLSAASLLAIILGSYVFSASARADQVRDITRRSNHIMLHSGEQISGDSIHPYCETSLDIDTVDVCESDPYH
jgi:hypothetical protein